MQISILPKSWLSYSVPMWLSLDFPVHIWQLWWLSRIHIRFIIRRSQVKFLPIQQHSYIATDKRGYPHNIFLISRQIHMLWYSLEAPRLGASNEYPQHMFLLRNKEDISIFRVKKAPYLLVCSYVETDHEIFSMIILSLLLIQEGQLSVSGERITRPLCICED